MKRVVLLFACCLIATSCDNPLEPSHTDSAVTRSADAPFAAKPDAQCPCWGDYNGLVQELRGLEFIPTHLDATCSEAGSFRVELEERTDISTNGIAHVIYMGNPNLGACGIEGVVTEPSISFQEARLCKRHLEEYAKANALTYARCEGAL